MKKNEDFSRKPAHFLKSACLALCLGSYGGSAFCAESAYAEQSLLTVRMNNRTVKDVFSYIEKNSEFIFVYHGSDINLNRKVSVDVNNQPVESILNNMFGGTDIEYIINDRQIIVRRKATGNKTVVTVGPQQEKKITVKGNVKDSTGEPLIGVNVLIKGSNIGSVTDIDGNFSLKDVDADAVISVSYIGYETQDISLAGKNYIDIMLREDSETLDEVVVVGYGTQKKSSMTASVATVSAKEIQKQVTSNVASTLQGRTPGVEVLQGGEAGADVKILVRGAGSFGATEPLYVIDGAFSGNGLNSVNPADIASIEILKDGSAAAIYGSRAANGVVIITTKTGKQGKPVVDISATLSLQTPSKQLDYMNADQWRSWAKVVAANSNVTPGSEITNPSNLGLNTDWQDLYFQNAPMYNVHAGISGGAENSTYNVSLGYFKQDGIVIDTGYDKYNARINGSYKKGRLSISENASLSYTSQKPKVNMDMGIPNAPVKDEFGRYVSVPSEYYIDATTRDINPLAILYNTDVKNTTIDLTGSFNLGFNFCKGFDYKLTMGGSYVSTHSYNHISAYQTMWDDNDEPVSGYGQGYTSLTENRASSSNYTIDNILTYNNTFGGHSIDAMIGTSWMREFNRSMGISSDNNDLGASTVTTYNGSGTIGTKEFNSALLSFFARLNYNYNERYLLSASIRRDESSKFAKSYRVGYFPAVSVGWNIHNEKFFDIPWVSKAKVRASYGELGANFIDPYSFLSLAYGPIPAVFGTNQNIDSRQMGYVTRFAQENLKWETAVSKNIGLELSFLNNSINFTAEYFWKTNKDLLAPLAPLPSSGQTIIINDGDLPYFNSASVENRGLELSLGYRKQINDWSVDIQGNISFLTNKVKS